MSTYAHPEALVSMHWVVEHLHDPAVRLVEVDWDIAEYDSGHAPGAVGWTWPGDAQHPLSRDIPDKATFEALLSRSGIAADTTVVLYGGLNNLLAAYTFWLMKIHGHADVGLLDGGRQKWMAEGRPMTTERPVIAPTAYAAKELNTGLRADRDLVAQFTDNGRRMLVDARPADMFNGQNAAGAQRGGHIPGAINLPAERMMNEDGAFAGWRVPTVKEDGTFRPVEELQALFAGKGITADKDIITYCVLGGLSSHAWFVLTQLLGYPNVREYDGSWAEWGNLMGAPIE